MNFYLYRAKVNVMKTRILLFAMIIITLTSCAELMKVLESAGTSPLTEGEVVGGLKKLLLPGKELAQRLSLENGYYGDAMVKILLPDEAIL